MVMAPSSKLRQENRKVEMLDVPVVVVMQEVQGSTVAVCLSSPHLTLLEQLKNVQQGPAGKKIKE